MFETLCTYDRIPMKSWREFQTVGPP